MKNVFDNLKGKSLMYKPLPRLCDKRPNACGSFAYPPVVRALALSPQPTSRKFHLGRQIVLFKAVVRDLLLVIIGKEPRHLLKALTRKYE